SHMIGMELGVSVASAILRREPTGTSSVFAGDVVSVAKRDLKPGEILDGEGGYCVTGTLIPSEKSLLKGALPIGLADGIKLKHTVPAGETVRWEDVEQLENSPVLRLRKEMEEMDFVNQGGYNA